MIRRIVDINDEKCSGCGLCAKACHEGAIAMINGKAKLIKDDYCDGLGDCLPVCPSDAIRIIEREAAEYDEEAVKSKKNGEKTLACGCPGSQERKIVHGDSSTSPQDVPSRLSQWPVQIQLVSPTAPYFENADLLVAADCTAYAYGNFHERFIKGRIVLVGCPKLDRVDYAEKLTAIFSLNDIKSITVTRMEVPCCAGLEHAVKKAVSDSRKDIDVNVVTICADGSIAE